MLQPLILIKTRPWELACVKTTLRNTCWSKTFPTKHVCLALLLSLVLFHWPLPSKGPQKWIIYNIHSRGVTRCLLHETRRDTRLGSRERDETFTLFLRNPQWWNIWMENSLLFNWKSQNAKQFRCILKSTWNECYFTSILMTSMQ